MVTVAAAVVIPIDCGGNALRTGAGKGHSFDSGLWGHTQFSVSLVCIQAVQSNQKIVTETPMSAANPKILLVDDDIAENLAPLLGRSSYAVAGDDERGLAQVKGVPCRALWGREHGSRCACPPHRINSPCTQVLFLRTVCAARHQALFQIGEASQTPGRRSALTVA